MLGLWILKLFEFVRYMIWNGLLILFKDVNDHTFIIFGLKKLFFFFSLAG